MILVLSCEEERVLSLADEFGTDFFTPITLSCTVNEVWSVIGAGLVDWEDW